MNRNTKRSLMRKMICNAVIISISLTVLHHNSNIMINAASANKESNSLSVEKYEVNGDDTDVARLDSTTETDFYNLRDNIKKSVNNVQKSVVENNKEEVVEIDSPVVMASRSETVLSEIVMSDEQKWASITYYEQPYTMYCNVKEKYLNVRSEAVTGRDNIIGGLHYADKVNVIGYNTYDNEWTAIEYRNKRAFVHNQYLSDDIDMSLRMSSYENPEWDGTSKLNSKNGKIEGPSGTETYYNLRMDRCIYYMNRLGYNYEVWTRDDGVKMFGDYVMVAADLDTRPKGSLVETSLGTGIVVDTGEFVNWNDTGIDIAVTW